MVTCYISHVLQTAIAMQIKQYWEKLNFSCSQCRIYMQQQWIQTSIATEKTKPV